MRPEICQRPVMPRLGQMAAMFCVTQQGQLIGKHGRGPTSDMDPLMTLNNCGSSSMLQRRSTLPTLVTRGSSR